MNGLKAWHAIGVLEQPVIGFDSGSSGPHHPSGRLMGVLFGGVGGLVVNCIVDASISDLSYQSLMG